ncbi:hypothetical protein AB0O34_25300 [Sphaerisporangium sp. NPDC088356]|uniref:hypothetical protein n=1 Tax=Sphaerisporangium sp. NPDC088356 TaxID=3154871 RepID=UPI003428780A
MFVALAGRRNRYGRPLATATLERVRATLRAALNEAVREGLIDSNPARTLRLPAAPGPRAQIWTDRWVAAWKATGERPTVAVWTIPQLVAFLDSVREDPLYPLWWLRGLRRGELAGLRWVDLSLETAELNVVQQLVHVGGKLVPFPPKSAAGKMDPKIKAVIAAIDEDAWTAIEYPNAVWDEQAGCWVSDAEIAEVSYTAFASKNKQAVTARLIVRRVKQLNPQAGIGQDELFSTYRYHAVFTDSPFHLVQAEQQHRDHAIVEQVFADLACGPLAHLPSGDFAANAAWVTCAAITQNLLRATGCLAGGAHAKARGATLRRRLVAVPARLARHGRGHVTVHLPQHWRWRQAWMNIFDAVHDPPPAEAV